MDWWEDLYVFCVGYEKGIRERERDVFFYFIDWVNLYNVFYVIDYYVFYVIDRVMWIVLFFWFWIYYWCVYVVFCGGWLVGILSFYL